MCGNRPVPWRGVFYLWVNRYSAKRLDEGDSSDPFIKVRRKYNANAVYVTQSLRSNRKGYITLPHLTVQQRQRNTDGHEKYMFISHMTFNNDKLLRKEVL